MGQTISKTNHHGKVTSIASTIHGFNVIHGVNPKKNEDVLVLSFSTNSGEKHTFALTAIQGSCLIDALNDVMPTIQHSIRGVH